MENLPQAKDALGEGNSLRQPSEPQKKGGLHEKEWSLLSPYGVSDLIFDSSASSV